MNEEDKRRFKRIQENSIYGMTRISTMHDLRPIIELLDQTEEPIESLMLLIGIGAARAAEFAALDADDVMQQRAHGIMVAVENICEEWGFTHGKNKP